jgi:hydroxymethylbilane synthase
MTPLTTEAGPTVPPAVPNASGPLPLQPLPGAATTTTTIHIGSRKSVLALIQTQIVHDALQAAWPGLKFEIHAMSTMGDKNQVTPLHNFGAKSLWTHELEAGLMEKKLDLIVHSLKGWVFLFLRNMSLP